MDKKKNELPDYKHTPLAPQKEKPESTEFKEEDYKDYNLIKPYGEDEINKHAGKCGGRRLLKQIPVTTDDGFCFVYLVKKPTRHIIKAIASKKKGKEPDEDAIETLMRGLVLEGDMNALDNDGAIYSALMPALSKLVNGAKVSIKEA